MKTLLTYLGVAGLSFGAGAVAWDWWGNRDWPTKRSYACEWIEGDGLFHTLYGYTPLEHSLYQQRYGKLSLASFGRNIYESYEVFSPRYGELYRAVVSLPMEQYGADIYEGVVRHNEYIVRAITSVEDAQGNAFHKEPNVTMEQRSWYSSDDPATLQALRDTYDRTAVAGFDFSYPESAQAAAVRERNCVLVEEPIQGGIW